MVRFPLPSLITRGWFPCSVGFFKGGEHREHPWFQHTNQDQTKQLVLMLCRQKLGPLAEFRWQLLMFEIWRNRTFFSGKISFIWYHFYAAFCWESQFTFICNGSRLDFCWCHFQTTHMVLSVFPVKTPCLMFKFVELLVVEIENSIFVGFITPSLVVSNRSISREYFTHRHPTVQVSLLHDFRAKDDADFVAGMKTGKGP